MKVAVKRVRFFKDQPVKRMRQGRHGIILTMLSHVKGQPGRQVTVSQDDWDKYGDEREVTATTMDDVRKLATG